MPSSEQTAGPSLALLIGEAATTAMVSGALDAWRSSDAVFTHDVVAVILLGAIENLPDDLRVLDTRPKPEMACTWYEGDPIEDVPDDYNGPCIHCRQPRDHHGATTTAPNSPGGEV